MNKFIVFVEMKPRSKKRTYYVGKLRSDLNHPYYECYASGTERECIDAVKVLNEHYQPTMGKTR